MVRPHARPRPRNRHSFAVEGLERRALLAAATGAAVPVEPPVSAAPQISIRPVSPDPRRGPVHAVVFSANDVLNGFDLSDLTLSRDGGPNLLTSAQELSGVSFGQYILTGLAPVTWLGGTYTLTLRAQGSGITSSDGTPLPPGASTSETWTMTPRRRVVARHVFYNNSALDGGNPAHNGADDVAVAADKRPLLPGQRVGPDNVTNYTRGLNGFMVDIADLPPGPDLTAFDFGYIRGTVNFPTAWTGMGQQPTVTVRRGAGVGGSDRVTLTWPDGLLRNTWLRLGVVANARTGLAADDVSYWGNLVGDAGDPARGAALAVNVRDLELTRRRMGDRSAAALRGSDFNRDGRVDGQDLLTARAAQRQSLPLFTAPTSARPVIFDNRDGRYQWRANVVAIGFGGGQQSPGTFLDVTRSADHQPTEPASWPPAPGPTAYSLRLTYLLPSGNQTPGSIGISGGGRVSFAAEEPRPVRDVFHMFATATGPVALAPGDLVGPGLQYATRVDTAYVARVGPATALFPSHGYVGLAITMDDGVHYGFIELQPNGADMRPLRWGYESRPGVPLDIEPIMTGELVLPPTAPVAESAAAPAPAARHEPRRRFDLLSEAGTALLD